MKNDNYTGILNALNIGWLEIIQAGAMEKKVNEVSSNMEREIYEQPEILGNLINKYITPDNYILINIPLSIKRIILIASGSSYHCAYMTAELLKDIADCDAECVYSSEFFLNTKIGVDRDTLFVFVSQSGETSDTLEALKLISKKTDKTLCVTNNQDSTIWELSNYKVLTYAGIEQSIASTKAMSAQMLCLYLLVLKLMAAKNIDITTELNYIKNLPAFVSGTLDKTPRLKTIARRLSKFRNIYVLGSRTFYALAKEGALKIKETSYINTTAYPQGEFMHGHVAVLNQKSAVISIIDEDSQRLCIQNLERMKKDYKPYIVTISNQDANYTIEQISNHNFKLKAESKIFTLFGGLVLMQLLALEIAKKLRRNIDRPNGLKKVVLN